MNQHLWSKDGSPTAGAERIQEFMSGQDVILDKHLLRYDIRATRAHARGIQSIGVLTEGEFAKIDQALTELDNQFQSGAYKLGAPFEDGHSAIEAWLTERLGSTGQKVHTGRSRNDQVQVAMRLYLKDQMQSLADVCRAIAATCLDVAETDQMTPMPGYTHLQRAVPSSVGLWMGSFVESFLDIRELANSTLAWIDCSPLGSAAGYGVNLALPREQVARELGFDRVQWNPMYVQNSRGRFELQCLSVLMQATLEMRRLSWDLSLYTSQEFGFVQLSQEFVTGSSIMPNKSNPDFVELARAQHSVVQAAITELQSLLSLPSGYQRDLQLCKPPVMRAFHSSLLALTLFVDLINGMKFDRNRMAAAIDPLLYSTDVAVQRVTHDGLPFREAYRQPVSEKDLRGRTPETSLSDRVSPGACGDLRLDLLRKRIEKAN